MRGRSRKAAEYGGEFAFVRGFVGVVAHESGGGGGSAKVKLIRGSVMRQRKKISIYNLD